MSPMLCVFAPILSASAPVREILRG